MPSYWIIALIGSLLAAAGLAAFILYLVIRYVPIIGRIFEEKPLFLPLRVEPPQDGEEVRFSSADGLSLTGSYFRARRCPEGGRLGVLVFCHEFLSDRFSFKPYADWLRDEGFDIFTFDFRNHGASDAEPNYKPLQWVTDHEEQDLRGVFAYLRARSDHDPAGFLLYGISRGGGAAICATAKSRDVWGVITDGAFPTGLMMQAYIKRWAEIYVPSKRMNPFVPAWIYELLAWAARLRSQRRLGCRFADVDSAVKHIAPRPWLAIHGARDVYIGPQIAQAFFERGGDPKRFWLVPKAKHNRCLESAEAEYRERVAQFIRDFAPRRNQCAPPAPAATPSTPSASINSNSSPSPGVNGNGKAGEPALAATQGRVDT